jgi:hypothetical protein
MKKIGNTLNRVLGLLVLLVAVSLVGCATVPTEGQRSESPMHYSHMKTSLFGGEGQSPEETKVINAPYDSVWNATIDTIQEVGHPIINTSKESGTLTTDWLERPGGPFLLGMPRDHFKDRFSIRVVKMDGSNTKVGIRRSVQQIQGIKHVPKSSDGEMEKWLLEQIRSKVPKTK